MAHIHVVGGTKAEYLKTAPVLRELDARQVPYRLVDTGQHSALTVGLRQELGIRPPDHVLRTGADVDTVAQGLRWALRLMVLLGRPRHVRREVFGGEGGICVVHGDTVSTRRAAALARRAGLRVAHLEAGLRSHRLLHPFPEELVRLAVMRLASVLFAPDDVAVANLRAMRVRARVVSTGGNTVVEALDQDLAAGPGPVRDLAVLSIHRLENLVRRDRLEAVVAIAVRLAEQREVHFVLHGPTRAALERRGLMARLEDAGVVTTPLLPHPEFVRALQQARLVVTDGGSVQEECALLGVPTLLWRQATERPDGIGRNVVLSGYRDDLVRAFLADPDAHRRPAAATDAQPSSVIVDVLLEELGHARRP